MLINVLIEGEHCSRLLGQQPVHLGIRTHHGKNISESSDGGLSSIVFKDGVHPAGLVIFGTNNSIQLTDLVVENE